MTVLVQRPETPPSSVLPALDPALERQLEIILARVPPVLRLPPPQQKCPYSGLSRASLGELVAPGPRNGNRPPVPATYLKANERARRGVWLIPAEGLFRYLLSRGSADTYAEARQQRQAAAEILPSSPAPRRRRAAAVVTATP